MSTVAEFDDDDSQFEEAMNSVRGDNSEHRYLVVGHKDGDPNKLELVAVGKDVNELGEKMENDRVLYALGRYELTIDMSSTVKFVYFHWIGDQVPFVKKGRYGVVQGSVQEKFQPNHMEIKASAREDFNSSEIKEKLSETFLIKSRVLESTANRQVRGFTASQLPHRQGVGTKMGVSAISTEGAKVEIMPDVFSDVAVVRSDAESIRWMLACYKDGTPKGPLCSMARGEGDLSELRGHLSNSLVLYGLYRISDVIDDITTVKFVFIIWVGSAVKPMTKAKISTHKGQIEGVFHPAHVTIYANELSDITERLVMDKVRAAAGTKKSIV